MNAGGQKIFIILKLTEHMCCFIHTPALQKASSKVNYKKIKNIIAMLLISASTILNEIIILPFTLDIPCASNRVLQKKCTSSFSIFKKRKYTFVIYQCYNSDIHHLFFSIFKGRDRFNIQVAGFSQLQISYKPLH